MWRVRKQIKCNDEIHKVYTGKNISVAILDTGIFLHPDLSERLVLFRDFVGDSINAYDDSGHGTHVAGCLCGSGLLSEGKYKGIAPGVNLVVGKVLNKTGNGSIEFMMEGLRWILEIEREYQIRILNISMSFHKYVSQEKIIRLIALLEEINDKGITVVTAAGNYGPGTNSLSPLGLSNKILSVGCHDLDYKSKEEVLCENYSGRGPGLFSVKKPDLVAPGTNIISLAIPHMNNGSYLDKFYVSKSGTSFASPLVSGALALLLEKEPKLNSNDIRQRVCFTATDLKEPWNKQGWGMLNINKLLGEF